MSNSILTKSFMNPGKTQYYGVDGTGRDTYIYNYNGGFCPEKQPTAIEGIGKFINKHLINLYYRIIRYHQIKTSRWFGTYSLQTSQLYQ